MAKRKKAAPKRPTRKLVLFVAEGRSDEDALQSGMQQLYRLIDPDIEVRFCRLSDDQHNDGGDITSSNGINPRNLKKYIDSLCVDTFLKREGYYPKDILEIIQIMDTDGAYIPDEDVAEDNTLKKGDNRYFDTKIATANRECILERNKRKRANMDAAASFEEIKIDSKTVPFSAYFFSCNLDHVLEGNANTDDHEKRDRAKLFSAEHKTPEQFARYFLESDASLGMDADDSWAFIRQGTNSLLPATNIDVLIRDILERIEEAEELKSA